MGNRESKWKNKNMYFSNGISLDDVLNHVSKQDYSDYEKLVFPLMRDYGHIKYLGNDLNEESDKLLDKLYKQGDIYNIDPMIAKEYSDKIALKLQGKEGYAYAPIILETQVPFSGNSYKLTGHSSIHFPDNNYISKSSEDDTYNLLTDNCSDATSEALAYIYNIPKPTGIGITTPWGVQEWALSHIQDAKKNYNNGNWGVTRVVLPIKNSEQYKRYKEVSEHFKNYYNSKKDSNKRQNIKQKLKNNTKYPHFDEFDKIRKSIEHLGKLINKFTIFPGNSIGNAAAKVANKKQGGLFKKGGGIYIKPENKGKFTATMKRTGKTVKQLTHSKNPLTRKRAIFAQNAKKWKHQNGGSINPNDLLGIQSNIVWKYNPNEAYTDKSNNTIVYNTPESIYHEYYGHMNPDAQLLQKLLPWYDNLSDERLQELGADLQYVKRTGDPGIFYQPEELLGRIQAALRIFPKNFNYYPESFKSIRKNEQQYGDNIRDLLHMYNDENLSKIFKLIIQNKSKSKLIKKYINE